MPTNLVASYDGVTALMEKGRAKNVTFQDFHKASDIVPHNILVYEVDRLLPKIN